MTDAVTQRAIQAAPTGWVSITPYKNGAYFLCGNNAIYLFHPDTNELKLLPYHGNPSDHGYTPTALHYSPTHNTLYVANYPGNNLLALGIDASPTTHRPAALHLIHTIDHPSLISPEGITVSKDGQYLASANCDGDSVTVFQYRHHRFEYMWHRPIQEAHGVAMYRNHVFVTGLTDHQLFDFELTTGKLLKTAGKFSNRVKQNGLLWPTHLQVTDQNELLLTDAHTGAISFFNLPDLTLKRFIGHNGASYQNLNLPYASLVDHNRFIVLSTFQDRILVGQRMPMHFDKSIVRTPDAWAYAKNVPDSRLPQITPKGYRNYTRVGGSPLAFLNQPWQMGYGFIHPKGNGCNRWPMRFNPTPDKTNFFYNTGRFYYVQYLPLANNGFMLQSPSNNLWMIVTQHGGSFHVIPYHHTSRDNWVKLKEGRVFTPQGIVTPNQILAKADQAATALSQYQHTNGWISPTYFSTISQMGNKYSHTWLKQTFTSDEGQQFIQRYMTQGPQLSASQLQGLGQTYYSSLYQRLQNHPEHEIYLPEFLLVSMLSHVNEPQIQQSCVANAPQHKAQPWLASLISSSRAN